MMRLGLLIELLAIVALMAGIPVPVAATVAILAATPVSAIAIHRILKPDKTGAGIIDVVFLFLTWSMLPCLLLLHETDGVGENVFRFVVAARIFAVVSSWRHLRQWQRSANNGGIQETSAQLTGVPEAHDN